MASSLSLLSVIPDDAQRVMLSAGEGKAPVIIMEKGPEVWEGVTDDFHIYGRTIPTQLTDEQKKAACTCGAGGMIPNNLGHGQAAACCKGFDTLLVEHGSTAYKRTDTYHMPDTWIVWEGRESIRANYNKFRWLCPIEPREHRGQMYDVVPPGIPNVWPSGFTCLGNNDRATCHQEFWEAYKRSGKNDHVDPRRRQDTKGWWLDEAFAKYGKKAKRKKREKPEHPDVLMKEEQRRQGNDMRDPLKGACYQGLQRVPRVWFDEGLHPHLIPPPGMAYGDTREGAPHRWKKTRRRSPRKRSEMDADLAVEKAYNQCYDIVYCGADDLGKDQRKYWRPRLGRIAAMIDRRNAVKERQRPKVDTTNVALWAKKVQDLVWTAELVYVNAAKRGWWGERNTDILEDNLSAVRWFHTTVPRLEKARRDARKVYRYHTHIDGQLDRLKVLREILMLGTKELGRDWYIEMALLRLPPQFDHRDDARQLAHDVVVSTLKRAAIQRKANAIPMPKRKRKTRADLNPAYKWGLELRDNTEEWGKMHVKAGRRPLNAEETIGVRPEDMAVVERKDMPPGFSIMAQLRHDLHRDRDRDRDRYADGTENMTALMGGGILRGLGEQGADLSKVAWIDKKTAVTVLPCARIGEHYYTEVDGKMYCGRMMWRGTWRGMKHGYDKVAQETTYVICWGEYDPGEE